VVDELGLPIEAADQYLRWLKTTGKSKNTVRAYAFHLASLFRWLTAYRSQWDTAGFDQLTSFMADLACGRPPLAKRGGGERDDESVRAAAAAVREFYEFHMVQRVGRSIDWVELHPHVLRHTHATALAKAGWTTAEIAARLGQSFASSADVYIHLASSDLETKLKATQHLIWPETPARQGDA
jgi:site-specific recombinase XerD